MNCAEFRTIFYFFCFLGTATFYAVEIKVYIGEDIDVWYDV